MTVKIEEGKFYRRRNGQVVGPARERDPHSIYRWTVGTHEYRGDGYWSGMQGHPLDLVEEVANPNETPQQAADRLLAEHQAAKAEAPFDLDAAKAHAASVDKAVGQQADEPAWKQDGDKARMDLIAPEFLFALASVLGPGAVKYAARNWEKGMSWGRVFGALMRHLWAWWGGVGPTTENFVFGVLDEETKMSHLWHAACCLMFLVAYEQRKIGTDDRSKAA